MWLCRRDETCLAVSESANILVSLITSELLQKPCLPEALQSYRMVSQNRSCEDGLKDEEGELLAVVLDTSFNSGIIASNAVPQLLDSIVTFCNAHLLNSSKNQLAVVVCHPHAAKLIFPSVITSIHNTRPIDGQMEVLAFASQVCCIISMTKHFLRNTIFLWNMSDHSFRQCQISL